MLLKGIHSCLIGFFALASIFSFLFQRWLVLENSVLSFQNNFDIFMITIRSDKIFFSSAISPEGLLIY